MSKSQEQQKNHNDMRVPCSPPYQPDYIAHFLLEFNKEYIISA